MGDKLAVHLGNYIAEEPNMKPQGRIAAAALLSALLTVSLALGQVSTVSPSNTGSAQGKKGSFLQVDGGKLYYEECGVEAATAVVLIHDEILDSAVWDDVWSEFCRSFHTIRYDRRGFGRSPAATSWYVESDDLAVLLRHAKVTQVALVGGSVGAALSIDFTLTHPEMVRQLVLVSPALSGMPYSQHYLDRRKARFASQQKSDVQTALYQWSKDEYLIARGNGEADKRLLTLLSTNPQDVTHEESVLPSKPALGRLGEINMPTLIITGDADMPDVHAHAGAIEAGIPRARRIVMSGVGHLLYLEKPTEFSRVAIEFLKSNED